MSKIPPKGSDEALEGLSQKDFAEPLELALDRKWEEAAGKLAGTLVGVLGGPLAGATAEHLARAAIQRFRGSAATLRFLEEGAKWDDEQAKEAARLEAEARFLRAIQQAICDDAETGASERGRAVVSALERWATRVEHLLEQVTNKLDGLRAGQRRLLEGQSRTEAKLDRMNAESALQARRALERYREWLLDRCDAMPGLFKDAWHVSKLSTVFVEPELCRDEQRRSRGTGGPSKGSDAAFADRRGASEGRGGAFTGRDEAWAERDGAFTGRDEAWAERDGAFMSHDEAWAERDGAFEGALRAAGGISLRELVERSSKDRAARWVVLGEPGSGKSTLARHLALELASESMAVAARSKGLPDEVPGLWPEREPASGTAALSTEQGVPRGEWYGPVPVYLELPSFAPSESHLCGLHPFDAAEEELAAAREGAEASQGLARALRQRSERPGGVWLLLDGLDELAAEQRGWVNRKLREWAGALPHVPIIVLSRPADYQEPCAAFERRARIQALDEEKQRQLLENWLEDPRAVDSILATLRARRGLGEACRVPLLLSLLAFLVWAGNPMPRSRRVLFQQAIGVLLERGHGEKRRGVKGGASGVKLGRELLQGLALALRAHADNTWSQDLLEGLLFALPEASLQRQRLVANWGSPAAFLNDIAQSAGLLVAPEASLDDDHGRPRLQLRCGSPARTTAPWRFLHRQFGELLAAEALTAQGPGALVQRAKGLATGERARWAAVLGFACELEADAAPKRDPLELLKQLHGVSEDLALRVLPEVEGVDPVAALTLLLGEKQWDGDFLVALLARWQEAGHLDGKEVEGWLLRQVGPARSANVLSYLHYALEWLGREAGGQGVEREAFFKACGRWPPPAEPKLVEIPGGEFLMGSSAGERGREDDEHQHRVRLSPFRISATAVTNEEYEAFDECHERERFRGRLTRAEAARHPVVNVSWWEARLYAAWRGCRLPTEAEWEYACRAGTTTAFAFGDDITTELVNYRGSWDWGDPQTAGDRWLTVGVVALSPNPRGLREMHGNVWEWCEDRYGKYGDGPSSDPRGAAQGHNRVVRGGSFNYVGRYCRSAQRLMYSPGFRSYDLGFRLLAGQPGEPNQ